jgi:hypothetical protein
LPPRHHALSQSGDTVTVSFQWFVNTVQDATTATLDSSFFAENDIVTVLLTPNDGEEDGPTRAPFPASVTIAACPAAATLSSLVSGAAVSFDSASQLARTSAGTAVAAPLTPLASPISISELNVCNIAVDRSLECTGNEELGLTNPPAGAYAQVAVARDYACAIRAGDQAIQCWGEPAPESGLLSPPEGQFIQIGLGIDAACGLRTTGELACWGSESAGAGTPPEGRFAYLAVSDSYSCAITADGLVSCWGE